MNAFRKLFLVVLLVTLVGILTSMDVAAQTQTEDAPTNSELLDEATMIAWVERFDQIFDGPNVAIADELFAEDFVGQLPLAPNLDREGWKNFVSSFYQGFSDMTETVDEIIVTDDRLIIRVHYIGTHDGPLFGIPATGREVRMDGIGMWRFNDEGKAVENIAVLDVVGVLAQIGAFPPVQE